MVTLIGFTTILASLSLLIGLFSGVPIFTSLSTSMVIPKTNTIICFLLVGITLLLMNFKKGKVSIFIFSVIILLIGGITLFEYLFGVDAGVDQFILKDSIPLSPVTLFSGRMTFISAVNFILIAFANLLFLKETKTAVWAMQFQAWLVLIITFISFCNYINEANLYYAVTKYTSMSYYSVVSFALLSIAILLIKPHDGIVRILLKNSTGGLMLRCLLLVLIFIPVTVSLIENHLEYMGLFDSNFGDTINITINFIVIGLMVFALSRLIDNREEDLNISKLQNMQNEMIFSRFAENVDIVFFRASPDSNDIQYISPAYERIWGKSIASLSSNPKDWFESILPEDQQLVNDTFFVGLQNGNQNASAEYRIKRPDGSIRNIYARAFPLKDHNQRIFSVAGIAVDMTSINKAKLYKKLESDILHLLEVETDLKVFSSKLLKMVCLSFDWEIGEVWLIDKSESKLNCVMNWHKNSNRLSKFVKCSEIHHFNYGEGLPGEIWETKKTIWLSDFSTNPIFIRSSAAAAAGLSAVFGMPIIYNDTVYGVLDFFSVGMSKPDDELLRFMETVSKYLGDYIQQKYTIEKLLYISKSDLLTGLLNRAAFDLEINKLISDVNTKSMAILLLDIDQFKLINEALGHDNGDIILKLVATRLSEVTKNKINISRFGDKFILCFPGCDENAIVENADVIFNHLKEPFNYNNSKINLTISMGVSMYPQHGMNSKDLITHADLAMANARNSHNKIGFYNEHFSMVASADLMLTNQLHQAILEDQFIIEYQPQINLKTGEICSAEALVRWQHPRNGLIYPGGFIKHAEESGFIIKLNEYIISLVFKQLNESKIQLPISINISSAQFNDGFHFVEFIESQAKKYNINPNQIEIEITENIFVNDSNHNIAVLSALSRLGFQIAIDDFGTGFSSFGYLLNLPFNKIKIDKSFIAGLPNNIAAAQITKSIIGMFHSLGKIVVAEGAESKEVVDFLKQENCDMVQGFYYYESMSLDKLKNCIVKYNRIDIN